MFGKIQKIIPINEWKILSIIGDFNVDITKSTFESQLIKSLSKQIGLNIHIPSSPTRGTATLDYMIAGHGIKVEQQQVILSPSDHQAINWTIRISSPQAVKSIKIPNRTLADSLMHQLLEDKEVIDAKTFLEKLSTFRKNNKKAILKTLKPKLQKTTDLFTKLLNVQDPALIPDTINKHWTDIWQKTEELRYSRYSGLAYKQLKNILKYHMFQKSAGRRRNQILNNYMQGTLLD